MGNSSSSVLVLNRTSPSLLHTFVAYTAQLSIAIQHTRNSFLNPHIPRKRLRASSCSSLSLLMNENISYKVYYVYCANLLLTNPRKLIITELYSFHRCMLVKNLFKETRPLRPNIINVVINVRAVQRNVFKIRKKSIPIPILHGSKLYCSRFR